MDQKLEKLEKVGKEQNLKSIVMDGVKTGKVGNSGKLEKSKTDKERRRQHEEKLCKSIIKGIARRNREKHAILAEIEKEEQDVVCIDDVTSKELPWHAVRKAREQELKYLRDLGVYEEDEREAIAHYEVTPVDTKWIDTCTSDPELLPENSKVAIHWRRESP